MTPEEQKLVDESFATMNLESEDLVADRVEQIKVLFPEVAVEGDGTIDFEKLRLILGDEVDEGQERYAFTWPGKADAIRQAQTPSTATLRPDKADSVDWDTTENLYIEGDNLEVLKLLQRGYHGSIDMIYIDPPYNTGHDFVYSDSFQSPIANYREQAGISGQSNANSSGRYHSNWVSMMYPRLRLARELLADDGVIFISIDDNEFKNLAKVCDEIFGEECFVTDIAWRSADASSNDAKSFSADYNHTLVYSKHPGYVANRLPRSEKDNQHYKNPDNDPNGPWFSGNVSSPNPRDNLRYQLTTPSGKSIAPPSNGWRWSQERMEEMISRGEVVFSEDESRIIKKTYLKDQKGIVPSNLWADLEDTGHNRNAKYELVRLFPELPTSALFSTPKPTKLIRKMLKVINTPQKESFTILDFFAGSSTTMAAVMEENASDGKKRRSILVQLPEPLPGDSPAKDQGYETLSDMGIERMRRSGQAILAEIEENNAQLKLGEKPRDTPDIGFRVLKLDSSNFDDVSGGALYDNIVKTDRSHDDIIFEMMLKWGLDLSLPMENVEIEGYPATSIAADELICCMDEGLTVPVLEAIAAREPKRVFFLDSILNDTLKLNAAQIFKRVGDRLGYQIELRTV